MQQPLIIILIEEFKIQTSMLYNFISLSYKHAARPVKLRIHMR
jgi:hypothetical protein